MSKLKVGDKVITPFGVGTFVREYKDFGYGFSVVEFDNNRGSYGNFLLQLRNEDLKLYKPALERLFDLGEKEFENTN